VNRAPHIFRIHDPVAIHRQHGESDATLRQSPARIERGKVLDGRRNHMLGLAGCGRHSAENRVIVRLRASAGEHDIRSARAYERGHGRASLLHRSPRILAKRVDRAGIAVFLGKVRQHSRQNFRRNRSRRVMVEVNPLHIEQNIVRGWSGQGAGFSLRVLVRTRSHLFQPKPAG